MSKKKLLLAVFIGFIFFFIQHYFYFDYYEGGFWILGLNTEKEYRLQYKPVGYGVWWSSDNFHYDIVFSYKCEMYWGIPQEPHWTEEGFTNQCDVALDFFPSKSGSGRDPDPSKWVLLRTIQYKDLNYIINDIGFGGD